MGRGVLTYLTQDEIRRLLSVIKDKRDKALFLIAYRHGLRASEVGLLRTYDVDFERMKIFIRRVKGGISGEQLMKHDEIKALRAYLRARRDNSDILFISRRGSPIDRRTLDRLMKRYCEMAGIPREKAHFHSLRHSIAVHMLDAGADVIFVKDLLGHKNIQNTLVYSRLTSKRRDEIHRMLLESPRIV